MEGTEFNQLALTQLAAYLADDPPRLRISGPPVTLASDFATPFGLVLHELATNAAKYGALSVETGRVAAELDSRRGECHPGLPRHLAGKRWAAGYRTDKRGFGGTLIERSLAVRP